MRVVNLHSFFEDLQEQQVLQEVQEEMGEMEGMGHREPEVIYVVEAAFPMFLILKVPIYLVQNTIRQL
jgi:hypothetical protein